MIALRNREILGVSVCICLGSASTAAAETYRATTWVPETNMVTEYAFSRFIDEVRTASAGQIDFDLFSGGALLPARTTLSGVGDGVAQLGYHQSGYTPAEAPLSNALSGMSFEEPDPLVVGFAYADWVMNDPRGYAEFRGNGVVPVGGFATPPYLLLCNSEAPDTPEKLMNKKIRFPGGQGSELAKELGFISVNIPVSEAYQAMQMGQVDCVAIFATYLDVEDRLGEVTKSVVELNLAPVFNAPIHIYNDRFWQSLSAEERRILLDGAASAMAGMMTHWSGLVPQSLDYAREQGISVLPPSPELQAAIDNWVKSGMGDMVGAAARAGVQDPEELYATFRDYLEKWEAIVGSMSDRTDVVEVTAVLRDNLFDKIDVETYGMD